MSDTKSNSTWGPRPLWGAFCVFVIAIVANLWVLDSPFRADDFTILSQSGAWLDELSSRVLNFDVTPSVDSNHRGNFRPVVWLLNQLESRFHGGPDAKLVHALSLILHALVCLILYSLVYRLVDLKAAWLAGILFAIHPAGVQSLTWAAARADILLTLFILCAVFVALRGGHLRALLTGILAAMAIATKASAVAALPILFVIILIQSKKNRTKSLTLFLLPLGLIWTIRWIWLGTWGPWFYMLEQGTGGSPMASILNGKHLLQALVDLLVPWTSTDQSPPLLGVLVDRRHQWIWGLPFVAILLYGLLKPKCRVLLMGCILAFLVLLTPLLSIWQPVFFGQFQNRNQYLPFACLAISLALAASSAFQHPGIQKKLISLCLVIVGIVSVDALISFRKVEIEATRRIHGQLSSVSQHYDLLEQKAVPFVIDENELYGGQYLLGTGLTHALKPPFNDRLIPVIHSRKDETFDREILRSYPANISIMRLSNDGRRFEGDSDVRLTPPLVPIVLLPTRMKDRPIFRPPIPLSGRSCSTFLLSVAAGPSVHLKIRCVFSDAQHESTRWIEKSDAEESLFIMDLPTSTLFAGNLDYVEVLSTTDRVRTPLGVVIPGIPTKEPLRTGSRTEAGFQISGTGEGEIFRIVTRSPNGAKKVQINLDWRQVDAKITPEAIVLLAEKISGSRPFVQLPTLRLALVEKFRQPTYWRLESYSRVGQSWQTRWFNSPLSR